MLATGCTTLQKPSKLMVSFGKESGVCSPFRYVTHKQNDKSSINNEQQMVPEVSPNTRRGMRVYRVVILGDGGVGKSGISIYHYFSYLNFNESLLQ